MENNEQRQQTGMNRRSFLKVGAAATTMGVIGAIKAPAKVANAAETMNYVPGPTNARSKLRPVHDFAGAKVRFVENNDEWLGTTKIISKVKKTSEADAGFMQAVRGLYGPDPQRGFFQFIAKHPFGGTISWARNLIAAEDVVDGDAEPTKTPIPDPEQMSQHIRDCCYFLRADEVGIGKMPEYGYYTHHVSDTVGLMSKPVEECVTPVTKIYPNVIVVMIDQGIETMWASTGYDGISGAMSMQSYFTSGCIAVIMAKYIRTLGYNARAHHAKNYEAIMPVCIMAAGLGELSRTGDCAIHPRLGYRHKVAAVTTDLPLAPDKPIDFGLLDFCRVCKKCADNCPNDAITFDEDPVEYNGYLRWNSDFKKCTEFRTTNEEGSSCGTCLKVCPWNSKEDSWFHKAGVWVGSKGEAASTFLKSIDDIFGYGTETIEKYKWWLEWPEKYPLKPM
ncbi:reductive dehalogenase [Desulfitobacterium sp. PCE1]|uniref:Putative ortho-chlorophenol reductive dehalogenase n=1 Tax=Desulfitobacterium sp. KBC1 TaxID=300675 RepID=Q3LHG1_9FIRM|nr:reductive dehalogenase [Desulfitobacterium sp. PCE1]BAE45337.1 putative ortho-chlorophenol reductive dehalogenase [Desulfitobacterium sp. KBC1]